MFDSTPPNPPLETTRQAEARRAKNSKEDKQQFYSIWIAQLVRLLGGMVLALTVLVMVGWLAGYPVVASLLADMPTMKFNTALGIALLGGALLLATHPQGFGTKLAQASSVCGGLAVLLAAVTLVQQYTDSSFGINELFVTDALSRAQGKVPGEMSTATAVSIVLLGASLICPKRSRIGLAVGCAGGMVGLIALGSFLIATDDTLQNTGFFDTMSIPTSIMVVMVSVARVALFQIDPEQYMLTRQQVGTPRHRLVVAFGVTATLITGMVVTAAAAHGTATAIEQKEHARFARLSERLITAAERRANQIVYGLKGARGVYRASESVTRLEFRGYVESRDLKEDFPGAIGIGYIQRVIREDLDAFTEAERADDAPGFEVKTAGDADDLYVIKYIDPLERNLAAWGYDVGSEKTRRDAVEKAVRTGEPTLTGRIDLVQDDKPRAGFLYLLPIYHKDSNPQTAEERFAALEGIVYSPVVGDDVFAGLMAEAEGMIDIDVFDGHTKSSQTLIFDADGHLEEMTGVFDSLMYADRTYTGKQTIIVGGRPWLLRLSTTPKFDQAMGYASARLVGLIGTTITLLVSALLWTLGLARSKALSLATAMTRDLARARTRAEELREEAEAATHAKSEFLANMSHEIRTPLTAILGYTELVREHAVKSKAPDEIIKKLDTIGRAGQHLLIVINDILDISKIEAGKLVVEHIPTPLNTMLLEVESLMSARASEKGIKLKTELQTPIPSIVKSDPTRLRQILMNIVGNAIKFTDQGEVRISVSVDATDRGGRLYFTVEDTGTGMTQEQVERLFQQFTQADTSITRVHGGTGLGLVISRRLAQMLGGDTRLDNTELGKGSRFVVELPLQPTPDAVTIYNLASLPASESEKAKHQTNVIPHISGRILLAEDGDDNQRLIAHHLRAAGATVDIAGNGKIALDMFQASCEQGNPYDLLLTDMQMPEMDGYTLARRLRERGIKTPIVALTAHALAEDRQKCLEAGCDGYATKPIDKHALIATCAQWMTDMQTPNSTDKTDESIANSQPTMPSDNEPLVSELADDEDFRELVVEYTATLNEKIETLNALVSQKSFSGLQQLAHQIKGSAGGYGFPSITKAAQTLEQHVKEADDVQAINDAVAELTQLCRRASLSQAPPPDAHSHEEAV